MDSLIAGLDLPAVSLSEQQQKELDKQRALQQQKIKYRSFKNMGVIALNEDMSKVNIQVQSNTSTNDIDVNEIYE
jgi:hypothetical protein